MITSAPKFILKEPNFLDDNTTSKELNDWENLMNIFYEFENASPGDSIATFWGDEYYFKVFVQ